MSANSERVAARLMRELVREESAHLLPVEIPQRPRRDADLVADEADGAVQAPGRGELRYVAHAGGFAQRAEKRCRLVIRARAACADRSARAALA